MSASGVRWERGYKIGWPCQASGLDLSLSVMVWIAYCVGSDVGRISSQSPPYCTQNTGIQQSPQKKLWRHPRSSALLLNWSKSRSTSHHNLFIHTSQHCWLVNFWQKDGNFGPKPGHFGKYLYICVLCFLFTGRSILQKEGPHTWSLIQDHLPKIAVNIRVPWHLDRQHGAHVRATLCPNRCTLHINAWIISWWCWLACKFGQPTLA